MPELPAWPNRRKNASKKAESQLKKAQKQLKQLQAALEQARFVYHPTARGKKVLEAFDNQAKGVLGLRTKERTKGATQNDNELGGLKQNADFALARLHPFS